MIDRLITALQQAGLILNDDELVSLSEVESILNDEDLADVLWLAAKMTSGEEPVEEGIAEVQPDRSSSTVITETVDSESIESPLPLVSAYIPESTNKQASPAPTVDAPEQGLPIQVRAAPALQDARSIARSLRPLMRKAASLTQSILDEGATVNRIAERDVWLPVLKPALERWLDLELVIESSRFGFIWESTLDEFQQLLERQGGFRNVRIWRVEGVDEGRLQLVPKKQALTEQTQVFRSPKELIDASGRRMVLYVSDCRSLVWQQGKIHDWLKLWSQHGPTAIVQLLPERLWEQSELDVGVSIQVGALTAGVPNHKLVVKESAARLGVDSAHALTLPVLTLTARSLKQLSLVVAAVGGQRAPARLFDLSWVTDPERDRAPSVIHPQTAAERVELFLATASPVAQRLARMMAAVPVSLSVVHLIQERLLPGSTPVHVAEVYSSSLLEPDTQKASSEPVQYNFSPGVRQLLNQATPEDETIDVLQELSQEIASTLGLPPIRSFMALLSPKSEWSQVAREAILPFAQIATQVLHNLGGDYASLAQTVEHDAARRSDWIQPVENLPSFPDLEVLEFTTAQLVDLSTEPLFPPLQRQEAEVVTIVLESDGLRLFEFEVATIERTGGERWEWSTSGQQQQAYQWVEALGNDIQLEMVAIPAGTFLMGSPDDEPDRSANEGPQHEVRISSFLMGRYPVTQAQWQFVAAMPQINRTLELNPSRFKGDKRPVEQVTWFEAVEFCDRLSAHTGRPYRLPSEAEWEYACRAGTTTPFQVGETLTTDLANYNGTSIYNDGPKGTSRKETTLVDQFGVANAFGLCDMHGNVREWCQDHWHKNYEGAPSDGSAWLSEDENAPRLSRGGSWFNLPWYCRSAFRSSYTPVIRDYRVGFRVVCAAPRTL